MPWQDTRVAHPSPRPRPGLCQAALLSWSLSLFLFPGTRCGAKAHGTQTWPLWVRTAGQNMQQAWHRDEREAGGEESCSGLGLRAGAIFKGWGTAMWPLWSSHPGIDLLTYSREWSLGCQGPDCRWKVLHLQPELTPFPYLSVCLSVSGLWVPRTC